MTQDLISKEKERTLPYKLPSKNLPDIPLNGEKSENKCEEKIENEKTSQIFGQSEEEIVREFRAFKASKLYKKFDFDLTGVCDPEILNSKLDEAVKYGYGNVVVSPKQVRFAKQKLKGKKIGVLAGVCYPFGEDAYGVKRYASKLAFSSGADGVLLPIGASDVIRGRIEQIKREISKIIRKNRKKKVYAVMEVANYDFSACEKVIKALSKLKISGIVCGTGNKKGERRSSEKDVKTISGGKTTVVGYSDFSKSREVIGLLSSCDRVFLKNATQVAEDLKNNLDC